jgi:hypothetical protein
VLLRLLTSEGSSNQRCVLLPAGAAAQVEGACSSPSCPCCCHVVHPTYSTTHVHRLGQSDLLVRALCAPTTCACVSSHLPFHVCLPACPCSWQLLGPASSLSSSLDVPAWQPRSTLTLGQLRTSCQAGAEVDFSGILVWAGDVNTGEGGTHYAYNCSRRVAGECVLVRLDAALYAFSYGDSSAPAEFWLLTYIMVSAATAAALLAVCRWA